MLPDRDPKEENAEKARKNWAKSLGLFSVITVDLLGYTGAGIGLGYWLWKKHAWPWWSVAVFSTLGLVLAFYQMYVISKKDLND